MKRIIYTLILLLSTLVISACQASQSNDNKPEVSLIQVVFDGKECFVSGQDSVTTNRTYFELDNQSNAQFNIIFTLIHESKSVDEIFSSFIPGSKDLPDGIGSLGRSTISSPGTSLDYDEIFIPGKWVLLCEVGYMGEKYFGAVFSVPE